MCMSLLERIPKRRREDLTYMESSMRRGVICLLILRRDLSPTKGIGRWKRIARILFSKRSPARLVGLAYQGKDIVFGFIIEYIVA